MIIEITFMNWEHKKLRFSFEAASRYYNHFVIVLRELQKQHAIYEYTITMKGDAPL